MSRVSLSVAEKSIDWLLLWYQRASGALRLRVVEERTLSAPAANQFFWGLNEAELAEFFLELDYLAMLDLLSAAEAAIRVDFWNRVHNKQKDTISRAFRGFAKRYNEKISLEEHILDSWVRHEAQTRSVVSHFKGALKLRHWLAHGRYWTAKLSRKEYSATDVFDICDELLRKLGCK